MGGIFFITVQGRVSNSVTTLGQKLTVILENNLVQKVFLNEKKNQKDSVDFGHRKLTLKVRFWPFSTSAKKQ